MTKQPITCKPFLKWPGGKRWLCPALQEIVGSFGFRRYFEPFLGGGALFFSLCPDKAFLSDVNPELINVYRQVKRAPNHITAEIQKYPVTRRSYNTVRSETAGSPIARASRFLFLNRTAFSGMYRLNREGKFNVPFGGGQRRPDLLWETGLLIAASRALRSATLLCSDFEIALQGARSGDLAYCDPTYTVAHNNNGFVRYNESNFSWADQQRLALCAERLRARGVTVLVSNAYHAEIKRLYHQAAVYEVNRRSLLCPKPEWRRMTNEFIFVLRP